MEKSDFLKKLEFFSKCQNEISSQKKKDKISEGFQKDNNKKLEDTKNKLFTKIEVQENTMNHQIENGVSVKTDRVEEVQKIQIDNSNPRKNSEEQVIYQFSTSQDENGYDSPVNQNKKHSEEIFKNKVELVPSTSEEFHNKGIFSLFLDSNNARENKKENNDIAGTPKIISEKGIDTQTKPDTTLENTCLQIKETTKTDRISDKNTENVGDNNLISEKSEVQDKEKEEVRIEKNNEESPEANEKTQNENEETTSSNIEEKADKTNIFSEIKKENSKNDSVEHTNENSKTMSDIENIQNNENNQTEKPQPSNVTLQNKDEDKDEDKDKDKDNESPNNTKTKLITEPESACKISSEKEVNSDNNKEEKKEVYNKFFDEKIDFSTVHLSKEEYDELIKQNPKRLFDSFTESKIKKWKDILYKNNIDHKLTDDSEILNADDIISNHQIVKNDVARTRVREAVLVDSFHEYLEFFIIYYCKNTGLKYKQGLNEIIGAMILLKEGFSITLSEIYNLIQGFINQFLTNYYYEEKLFSLRSSLSLLSILLRFHEPEIFNIFEKAMITPEMYGMSWVMTALAGKARLNVLYRFWDKLIEINDSLFMHFVIVAFLREKKENIIKADYTVLAVEISQLLLESPQEVDNIIERALKYRRTTPYSFRLLSNYLEIFNLHSNNLEEMNSKYKPQNFFSMPIFPSEIFFIEFPDKVFCPDNICQLRKKVEYKERYKLYKCEHCDMKIKKELNPLLVDLRLHNKSVEKPEEKTGFLPTSVMVEQKELRGEETDEEILKKFSDERGKYQFIFLTTQTDYFEKYEANYYQDHVLTSQEKYEMLFVGQTKFEKELNMDLANQASLKEKIKLKEYDNLKRISEKFLKNNTPYVSYIYGGFNEIHELCFKYEVNLVNHNPKCYLCKEMKKRDSLTMIQKIKGLFKKEKIKKNKNKQKKKKEQVEETPGENREENVMNLGDRIKLNDMSEIMTKFDYNLYFGLLKEFREEKVEENFQVIVTIQSDELNFYKFEDLKDTSEEDKSEIELVRFCNINLLDIQSIANKKDTNHVVSLRYFVNENESEGRKKKIEERIVVDFFVNKNSKKFVFALLQTKRVCKRQNKYK